MGTYIEKESKIEKLMFWFMLVPVLILAVVVFTQPVWRGEEMVAEYKANCDKVGGIILETKTFGGTSYECSPRYDK